jgi:hypothetical protein
MNDQGAAESDTKVAPILIATGVEWCGQQVDNTLGTAGFFITFDKQDKYKLSGVWNSDVPGFQKDKNGYEGGTFTGRISKSDGETVTPKLKQKGIKGGFVSMAISSARQKCPEPT